MSNTQKGLMGESYVFELLKKEGIKVQWEPFSHGPDFTTEDGLCLDVKVASKKVKKHVTYPKSPREVTTWTYNLHHHGKFQDDIDFFLCVHYNTETSVFVFPSTLVAGKTLVISDNQEERGKYDYFKNNFNLIKEGRPEMHYTLKNIDNNLWKDIKVLCAQKETSIKDLIITLLQKEVDKAKNK